MNYTIFTPAQITPEKVIRRTLEGADAFVENPEQITMPANTAVFFTPPGYSRFSSVVAERSLLLEDIAGNALYSEIVSVFPSLIESRLQQIRAEARERIEAKYPLWVQLNCVAGVYSQSVADACKAYIADVISKSNIAEDLILQAQSVAELFAVKLEV